MAAFDVEDIRIGSDFKEVDRVHVHVEVDVGSNQRVVCLPVTEGAQLFKGCANAGSADDLNRDGEYPSSHGPPSSLDFWRHAPCLMEWSDEGDIAGQPLELLEQEDTLRWASHDIGVHGHVMDNACACFFQFVQPRVLWGAGQLNQVEPCVYGQSTLERIAESLVNGQARQGPGRLVGVEDVP